MDRDCAVIVVSSAARAARDLTSLVTLLDSTDEKLKMSISSVIYDIMENIIAPIQEGDQSLKVEIESRMRKYGRMF